MSDFILVTDVFIKFRIFFIPDQQHRKVSLGIVVYVYIHVCIHLFSFILSFMDTSMKMSLCPIVDSSIHVSGLEELEIDDRQLGVRAAGPLVTKLQN